VLAPDEAEAVLDAVAGTARRAWISASLCVLTSPGSPPSAVVTSEWTAVMAMSSRSPLAPVTVQPDGPSTSRHGGDIQLRAFEPLSAWMRIVPSALTTSRRSASGSVAERRPV
jgi:hypothetical protein